MSVEYTKTDWRFVAFSICLWGAVLVWNACAVVGIVALWRWLR